MAKKDYYETLGVSKNDSIETIKKRYKKLALKFHPDKAEKDKKEEYEENFKKINEAYSVIGDEEKRRKYDVGETGQFNQETNFRGGFSDIFEELLRGGSFGNDFGSRSQENHDLHYRITIGFTEAAFGYEKKISIKRKVTCDLCDGTGAKNKELEVCQKCGGQGRIKINQRTPWGIISQAMECDKCHGTGKIPKKKCRKCDGLGLINKREKVKIKIPAGIDDGQTLRIPNNGNAARGGRKGDLFLTVQIEPHKIFKREGFDIYMEFPITFSQAALGDKISIPTLKGNNIKIKIGKGTDHGTMLRLKGRGIPFIDDPFYKGDQFVKITIETPKKLNHAQTKLFKELKKLDNN